MCSRPCDWSTTLWAANGAALGRAARRRSLDDDEVAVLEVGGVAHAVAVDVGDAHAGGGEVEGDRLADEAGAADVAVALDAR